MFPHWESATLNHPHAHASLSAHIKPDRLGFLDLQALTCFQGGGALVADVRPAAHRGTGAQVELVFTQRLQVTQDPRGGLRFANIYCLQWSHFFCVID